MAMYYIITFVLFFIYILTILTSDKTSCEQNVAFGANVTLESTYTHQNPSMPDGDGYKAVDGNTSSDWYVGGCACTKRRHNPWMTLDFGSVYTIERMVIYNRYDEQKPSKGCCRK